MKPALESFMRVVAAEGPRRITLQDLYAACDLSPRFPIEDYFGMLRKMYVEENGVRYSVFQNLEYQDGVLTVEAGPGLWLTAAETTGAEA